MRFTIGHEYRRDELHEKFGGSRYSGISPCVSHPLIFLFTGETGEQYGYSDSFQPDGTFWYTGEGQVGDMQMTKGNLAIRDSDESGRALHLFQKTRPSFVRYLGEGRYLGHHEALIPDRNGDSRTGIIFELEVATEIAEGEAIDASSDSAKAVPALRNKSLTELRELALQPRVREATPTERRAVLYQRSQAVRAYALKRAAGMCEGCGNPAPFTTSAGEAYLEVHHIRQLSDGGSDHPRWVSALCPNCHRRVHHASDGKAFNEQVAKRIAELEAQSNEKMAV